MAVGYTSFRTQLTGKIKGRVDAGLNAAAAVYVERVRASFSLTGRGTPSSPGQPPSVQTGDLRRRLYHRLKAPGVAVAGSNLKYARIQELGGTIVAKGKKLAVPIGERGRRLAKMAGGNLRSLDLHAERSKSGALLLYETVQVTKGRRGKGKRHDHPPVFALVDSVTLPARPYLRPMLRKARADMQRAFIRGAQGGAG